MIFEVFTGNLRKLVPLLLILILALTLRLYKIDQAFSFDFDQEVAANAAYNFFKNHKISLIGQELSFSGFFIGPLHNWIQFIPYGICNLSPSCVPYFYIAIGVLTAVIHFKIVKEIFDSKTAFIAAFIYAISFMAISFERGVNSNFFIFLTSSLLLYCYYKFHQGDNRFLILGSFLLGLAVVNFNPVYIFTAAAFFLAVIFKTQKKLKLLTLSLIPFLINYLPLVLFNFRHQNILLSSLTNFANENIGQINFLEKISFLLKVQMSFFSVYIFNSASSFFMLTTIFLILISWLKIDKLPMAKSPRFSAGDYKSRFKISSFLILWIIVPLVGFVFYKGWIPDYYFQQSLVPLTVLIASIASKNIFLFLIFISIASFQNIKIALNFQPSINYQYKKAAVEYIISQAANQSFNVYYDFPPGFNTGYDYLFKIAGKEPQEGDHNIFIIKLIDSDETENNEYFMAFPDRRISFETFGGVQVISAEKKL